MNPFTYVVLRYVHDNAAGESLNVGVLLSAANGDFVDLRVDRHHGRLSATFRDFPVDFHRHAMRSLNQKVRQIRSHADMGQGSLFPLGDAGKVIRALWPDAGLNYQASETKAGEARDLRQALDALYDRFVTRQAPDRRPRQRRADEDVWKDMARRLPAPVAMRLRSASIEAGPFTFRFDHTYQNGKLHVIEPLSFDLLEADSVRDKSMRWIGYASHLMPYLGTLSLVVEGPEQDKVKPAYQSALEILRGAVEVYELNQADRLSNVLSQLMR